MPTEPGFGGERPRSPWFRLFVRPSVAAKNTREGLPLAVDAAGGPEADAASPPNPSDAAGAIAGFGPRRYPTRHARFFRVRERIGPLWRLLLGLAPPLALLGVWFWLTSGETVEARRVSILVLPSPVEVANALPSLWFDSALMRNILTSLGRVLGGFAIAAAIAVPLGLAMGSFSKVDATFSLVATMLSYLPIAAMVPLTIVWWGTGEAQKVGFLAVAGLAYLLPMVVRAVNKVDHGYVKSACSQGASAWQVASRVLVPISLPDIYNALRLCLGIGWTYIILAELIRSEGEFGGVGNLIQVAQRRQHMDKVYLTLVAIMVVGALLDRGCARVGKWLFACQAEAGD